MKILIMIQSIKFCFKHIVISTELVTIDFEKRKDNYFAVYDLDIVNNKLKPSIG